MLVAGVDGCKGGWVVALVEDGSTLFLETSVFVPTFEEMLTLTRQCAAVGVDVPIGLMENGPRAPDLEARRRLGSPRSSSVFPSPARIVLTCFEYREACDASFSVSGKRISKQLFGLLPKIREADRWMTPAMQQRVLEVHPEICFWAMNGSLTVPHSKHTSEGLDDRYALLSKHYALDIKSTVYPQAGDEG